MNVLLVLITSLFGLQTSAPAAGQPDARAQLIAELHACFQENDPSARRKIAAGIAARDNVDIATITEVLQELRLWPPHDSGFCSITLPATTAAVTDRVTSLTLHVPDGYDPIRRYPLLLALHGAGGNSKQFCQAALSMIAGLDEPFIVAAPSDYTGVWLGSSQEESAGIPVLLRELRRRFHIDADRVYVSGYSLGGHAAFALSTLYTDEFAAAVPLAGTLSLQSGWEAVQVMLPNLGHTPVLAVYGARDGFNDGESEAADQGIAAANRHLAGLVRSAGVPVELIELNDVGHLGVTPPGEKLAQLLEHQRPHAANPIAHWFRYPSQGRCGWLRQHRFYGDVWTSQQVVVRPAVNETYSEAMSDALRERLAHMTGRIDEQTIEINSRKCAVVDVLLSDDLIDMDQPVTVFLDGTRRFDDYIKRSVVTLLELAYDDWDFDRLWTARIRVPRSGLARQE